MVLAPLLVAVLPWSVPPSDGSGYDKSSTEAKLSPTSPALLPVEHAPVPPPPTVVVSNPILVDNGDGDGWADTSETVSLWITVYNRMGVDLTGLVAHLSTNDPKIACIADPTIVIGDLADRETRRAPAAFRFAVADVGRATVLEDFAARFDIEFEADQAFWRPIVQHLVLDFDLDAVGGTGPTTFFEGFEAGFGAFTSMQLDEGLNPPDGDLLNSTAGLINADGYRCQYSDPDWEQTMVSNLPGAIERCFPNPQGLPDAFFFQTTADRAFSGEYALYYGVPLNPSLGFTTPIGQLEAVATTEPINAGWHSVCSVTRMLACDDEIDCPLGETCEPAAPVLSIKHQVSLVDERFGGEYLRSTDRAVVQAQLADADGNPAGNWIKLEPMLNAYDTPGSTWYDSCYFDPIDDGNTEDDFFDPDDPERLLGPSSTCYPEYTFVDQGDTGAPFDADAQDIGDASDGPGLEGNTGIGTWIESRFDLSRFRARRVRLRLLATGIKLNETPTWEEAWGSNPDPRDDGWFIDDVTVADTLSAPAVVGVDEKPNDDLVRDGDFDGVGATCDCSPADETVWMLPGEARDLMLAEAGGVTNLSWQPPADLGGTAVLYDVLQAAAPDDFVATGSCVEAGGADLAAMDATVPSPDLVQFYLVRARHACGAGSLGLASSGEARIGIGCP